jgi:hypothetical protein
MAKKSTKTGAAPRLRRKMISISSFATMEKEDKEFWLRQTPNARLRAVQLMRQINYGKAASGRLQRLLEIV